MNLQSMIPGKKEERSLGLGNGNGDPLTQLQQRMNSVFEDFFGRSSSDLWGDTAEEFLRRIDVERAIALPQGIDAENAKAKFRKGVLKVTLPKRPEAQSLRRKIELTES